MKINPDDPWYPIPFKVDEKCSHGFLGGCPTCRGVTIRLKLAAMAMQGWLASFQPRDTDEDVDIMEVEKQIAVFTFEVADAMIERANPDEGQAG